MIQHHDGRTLLTVLETADLCGVSLRTVWGWIRDKRNIEVIRVGAGRGRPYVVRDSLFRHGPPPTRTEPIRRQVIAFQPPPVAPERRPVVYTIEPPAQDVVTLADRFQGGELTSEAMSVSQREAVHAELIRRAFLAVATVCLTLLPLAAYAQPPVPHLIQATHIVAPTHPQATDTNNPNGTIQRPRATIPNPVPPCAIVELGPYATAHTGATILRVNGTPSCPVVIRGIDPVNPSPITGHMEVAGSYATFVGLKFQAAGPNILAPSDHVVIRDSEMVGVLERCTGAAIVSYAAGAVNRNIVFYRNRIHHNGDVKASVDQDCHGLVIAGRAEDVYVLQNHLYLNSGDGLQINAGPGRAIRRVWVTENTAYQNKQAGLWTKQASEVFFIRNVVRDHRPSNSSLGVCMGAQYGPDHVWFIDTRKLDDGQRVTRFVVLTASACSTASRWITRRIWFKCSSRLHRSTARA